MAEKPINAELKLQIPAGQAEPSPPVGPALGQHGVNIVEFCNAFNEATGDREPGILIPVEITVYQDRSFDFVTKTPPASTLLKKKAGLVKAAGETGREVVAGVTREDVRDIAETKLPDLNAYDVESAMKIVAGTARSMGIEIGEDVEIDVLEDEGEEPDEAEDEAPESAGAAPPVEED